MASRLRYIGSLTAGVAFPVALAAAAQIDVAVGALNAAVSLSLPDVSARLSGALKTAARFGITPPSLTATAELAVKIVGAINLAIGVRPPSLSADLAIAGTLAFAARLEGIVVGLEAQLAIGALALQYALKLKELAAAGGVRLYLYEGTLADLSKVVQQELCDGVTLGPLGLQGGINATAPIYTPLIIAETNNPGAVAAIKAFVATP
jgi:hypothetical protein